jgi:hypothetical protein
VWQAFLERMGAEARLIWPGGMVVGVSGYAAEMIELRRAAAIASWEARKTIAAGALTFAEGGDQDVGRVNKLLIDSENSIVPM